MLPLLSQVLTIRERRQFKSIPTQLGNLFLTQTEAHPAKVASGHLWYNSGLTRGSNQRRTLRDSTNLPGRSGLEPTLGLTPLALRTSLLPTRVALGHIWYNLGTHFVGSISAAQPGTTSCQDVQAGPKLPARLVVSLRVRRCSDPRLYLSCTKGDLRLPWCRYVWVCVSNNCPAGCNRFELSSLLDIEKLGGAPSS